MTLEIGKDVPWNAAWSGEDRYEIRPCRYASGKLAIWSPFAPGSGRPIFAKPHCVRQRKSIVEMRCTVCGKKTTLADRWWFPRGGWRDGLWMSTESPVHAACAAIAIDRCPELRSGGDVPIRFPLDGACIVSAIVGGAAMERDFGLKIGERRVVGHLKFAWRLPYFLQDP